MSTSQNDQPTDQPIEPSSGAQRDDRIQSPHDRLINQTLQQIDAARTLLAEHLPREVVQHLKLDTLAPVDTSFIDQNLPPSAPPDVGANNNSAASQKLA